MSNRPESSGLTFGIMDESDWSLIVSNMPKSSGLESSGLESSGIIFGGTFGGPSYQSSKSKKQEAGPSSTLTVEDELLQFGSLRLRPVLMEDGSLEPPLTEQELSNFFYTYVIQDGKGLRVYEEKNYLKEIPNELFPHGLWPKVIRGVLQTTASDTGVTVPEAFNIKLIPADLSAYWFNALGMSMRDQNAHKRTWKHQWEEHGVYGLMKQEVYYRFVRRLQKYFGPIVNRYVKECTIVREIRKYLNVKKFILRLQEEQSIYVTVHGWKKTFTYANHPMTVQILGEVRIYLDGKYPIQTIRQQRLNSYDEQLEMNIYDDPSC